MPAKKKLRVQVYNQEGSVPFQSLVDSARQPFDLSGIETEWIDALRQPKTLMPYALNSNLGLRVTKGKPGPNLGSGYAVPGGVLSSIYPETLQSYRRLGEDAYHKIVGMSGAHEIGHLTGKPHSKKGLMRANFRPEELNDNANWGFIDD